MKKLLLAFVACLFLINQALASQVLETLIAETRLDADPVLITGTTYLGDCEKVAFFVNYDETEVGGVAVAVTMQISYDGTNWLSASFYDYAGGATLQTSESLTSDSWYYCWFNKDLTMPYVKLIVTATGSDADDLVDVTAYVVKLK